MVLSEQSWIIIPVPFPLLTQENLTGNQIKSFALLFFNLSSILLLESLLQIVAAACE